MISHHLHSRLVRCFLFCLDRTRYQLQLLEDRVLFRSRLDASIITKGLPPSAERNVAPQLFAPLFNASNLWLLLMGKSLNVK